MTCTVTDVNGCITSIDATITQPASAVSVSLFAQTDVLCFGNSTGSATATAAGGVGPYNYTWNTVPVQHGATAINLTAGTYTCTAADVNGCTGTVNVTIAQPAATLSASITAQTNVGCFGANTGSATISVVGGTAPYTYNWNSAPAQNTATLGNVPVGTYTCTVTDANGCTTTQNATITQPAAALSASVSGRSMCSASATTLAVQR